MTDATKPEVVPTPPAGGAPPPVPSPETPPQPAPAPAPPVSATADKAADVGPAVPAPAPPPAPETGKPAVIVRYGAMGLLGRFTLAVDSWRCGQRYIIKSDRGMEIGSIVCAWGGCAGPQGINPQIKGEVLRPVTHVDEVEERHLLEGAQREFAFCKQCVVSRSLPMKMVAVEHLFGGDRIVFYFVSESRVDFRALVRDLAHEFQTRIEMRQIGVRDEARLLGDYERCGRPLCCRAWIKELEPVSMKMAKVQKATLDPTKISGRCGRLMCCLRFEHAIYRDLSRNLPRKNTLVMTAEGRGKVIDTDVVTQMVAVLMEKDGSRAVVPVERVKPVEGAPADAGAEVREAEGRESETLDPPEAPPQEMPEPRLVSYTETETATKAPAGSEPAQAPAQEVSAPPPQAIAGPDREQHRGRRGRRNRRGRGRGGPPPGGAVGSPSGPSAQGSAAPPSPPSAPPPSPGGSGGPQGS